MTHTTDLHHSVRQIRRRLFLLLMQAFGAVVLLTIALLLVLVGGLLGGVQRGRFSRFMPPVGEEVRAYYLGRGGWAGIEAVLPQENAAAHRFGRDNWRGLLLLDEAGRVLIDEGRADTARVGQVYALDAGDGQFPLIVNNKQVGALVIPMAGLMPEALGLELLAGLAVPLGVISFFTGGLTLLIGLLLVRRVVAPLADVVAAAHAVAAGDLSTRVRVSGPSDLRSLSDSFNHMAEALERSDRERRDLLADIAHELRTPLTVIRGRLEGIVDGVYSADEAHVAPVLEETYVLERLVEDLRLLTLAESRQLHFDRQLIDLGELAERAADLFGAEAEEKSIHLSVRADADAPTVVADPQRVGQVIGNLLSNALRYGPQDGEVTINVRRADSPGRVALAVRDNGPGVPDADLPKLFDRFWRGEKSRGRGTGGGGLGLAIARQLVEAQGGVIAAANLPGGGLEISFVL